MRIKQIKKMKIITCLSYRYNMCNSDIHIRQKYHVLITIYFFTKYYNDIFDNIHCCGIDSSLTKSTDIFEKIKSVIHAKKDWKEFQDLHFKGNHSGSSSRILDHIGKTI